MAARSDRLVSLSSMPAANTEHVIRLENLSGGLNLWELDYRMDGSQSPEMKNLWWRDGLLGCRDGQRQLLAPQQMQGICAYERLFWGHAVMHCGDGLYAGKPEEGMTLTKLCDGLPSVRGVFFRYLDGLFYKTAGAYKKITYDPETGLQAADVQPYVPVISINADAATGSGDGYQPENRLSAEKTVWYNAADELRGAGFSGNGTAKAFHYTVEDGEPVTAIEQVQVDGTYLDASQYTVSEDYQTITFLTAPASEAEVVVLYRVGVRVYHLPVTQVDAITAVEVDGEAVTDYEADPESGTVTFAKAPPVQDPPENNTVKITYAKENKEAAQSIMDCRYGCVYGGAFGTVVVLAGSEQQPNAYFWNGNHIVMDPGYFPMEHYNLAGDTQEPVTGFGRQAGYLVVFKTHAMGRCEMGTVTIGERVFLTLNYTSINAAIGCDLPWSIQMAENNLVWCNTYGGVYLLQETNAALENTVACLSRNVAGCDSRPGLLQDVRLAETVCSLDDGERYWVATGDHVYVWDHGLSGWKKPSWFFFTNIGAVSFFRGDSLPEGYDDGPAFTGARRIYHLDQVGRITRFDRDFRDYGGPIEKVYRFAAQSFGGYDRLKHIHRMVLTTRSDTDTLLRLWYLTDWEQRQELTPIRCLSWRLWPRNLAFRYLGVRRFAHVAVRRPNCRNVRHFALRLENKEAGCDMSIVSAEIYYTRQSRER